MSTWVGVLRRLIYSNCLDDFAVAEEQFTDVVNDFGQSAAKIDKHKGRCEKPRI